MAVMLSMIILVACTNGIEKTQNATNEIKQDEQPQENINKVNNITNASTKIEERREEFLGRLDNIQKQLDALPEKKDSDAGITNAMRSYYGEAFDMYDEALNEIYSLLKEQLSQDAMKSLKDEENNWIAEKEDAANKEAAQYKGGTFEFVAYNMSLYESTKKRCYELVNNYMTDSKIKINASKQDYVNKLDNIENKILSSKEYKNAENGITNDMMVLTDKEYNEWDGALNEIYNLLKQQLPSDKMKELQQEEEQWIIQKENKAKKVEESQGLGSQLGKIAYKASLAHTTQSRCYELVYRYMR